MSGKHIFILLLSFLGISLQAQRNYLAFDYSISQFKPSYTSENLDGILKRLNRCEGNYAGASYHFAVGRRTFASIGIGISKINYKKEWLGTFPESNQFGIATVDGQISYWSFPISYTRIIASATQSGFRNCRPRKEKFRFGFSITYTPSFEGKNFFSATTSGGADLNTFLSGFQGNTQSFQHSLTAGFCNQFFLINKSARLDLEPYAGIGSSYFKEGGTSINNLCYGLRLRIALSAKLPKIRIEKEVNTGNAEEKKKLLEQKQKEIQEQLNRNPK
jgi:hypothetical protein